MYGTGLYRTFPVFFVYLIALFISQSSPKIKRDSVESPLQEIGRWNCNIYMWMTA
jgi:hypothetical protein